MTAPSDSLREASADQIVGGFLASIKALPAQRKLDAIMTLLERTFDREIRALLLREFNDLTEREETPAAPRNLTERERA